MKSNISLLILLLATSLCWMAEVRADNVLRGDVDGDGNLTTADARALANYLTGRGAVNVGTRTYVDLGLPSGTLWATTNVGADNSWEAGDYYAWGETQEKSTYTWANYLWATPDTTITRYAQSGSSLWLVDDVANMQWGGLWRVPTIAQWQELVNYCRWSWALVNGQYGYRVTANGTGIFLPSAGYWRDGNLYEENLTGFYWARDVFPADSLMAYGFYMDNYDHFWGYRYRYTGRSVRPTLQMSDLLRYDVNGDGHVSLADLTTLVNLLTNNV